MSFRVLYRNCVFDLCTFATIPFLLTVFLLKKRYFDYLSLFTLFLCLRFLWKKCTVLKLFGLCMVLALASLLWLQLSCSADLNQALLADRPPHQPCPLERQTSTVDDSSWGPHKLAVIIPFRERFEELLIFVPYMHAFLNKKKIRHKILVINQVDHFR